MESNKEYFAFISYQREDERWAKWLQHKLEHYKLPSNLNGRTDFPKAIRPIFRDASELTPGNLPRQIHEALEQSKYLIVVCSPRSAHSEWVNKEIETFISMGRTANVIPFIIEGAAFSKDSKDECFPLALRQLPEEQEILGANINEMGRDAAAVKVVARMFDVKFDSLWQRHEREQRRQRWMRMGGLAAFAVAVLLVAIWIGHQNVLLKEKDWKMMENQSRAVADKAIRLVDEGDACTAQLLALEALPKDLNHPNRPYTFEAESALRRAYRNNSAVMQTYESVAFASFSPDGKRIVSASWDVRIWDAETGQCLHKLEGHTNFVWSVSFSPDSKRIVSASFDKTIRIWDAQTGQCLRELKGHYFWIYSAFFSPDGKKIVSGSGDRNIRIWDAETGQCLQTWGGGIGSNIALLIASYSPDGKRIIAAAGNTISILDAQTGQIIQKLEEHTGEVISAFFSPDGKRIVSASADNTIKIWDFPPLQQLIDQTRERFKNRKLSEDERRKYYLE